MSARHLPCRGWSEAGKGIAGVVLASDVAAEGSRERGVGGLPSGVDDTPFVTVTEP